MKRTIIFAVLAFLFAGYAYAQSPNDMSRDHYNFIIKAKQFLTEEGFSVTYDESDESLNFKREGNSYWIEIRDDDSPFYIRYHRAGFSLEDVNLNGVYEACNYANLNNYCSLAVVGDDFVSFTTEFYCASIESFRATFYKNLRAVDKIRNDVKDYYNEHN